MDRRRSLPPAAVRVRPHHRGARAGDVFGENRRGARNTSDLVVGGIFTIIPLVLIAKQPDLGTAVTLLPVFLGAAYLAGLRMRLWASSRSRVCSLGFFAYKFVLKDYQKSRIETFLDPEQDPRGAGYQTIQARITVGSGGLTGKGFRRARRGSTSSCPSPITISSSRCWPRSRGSRRAGGAGPVSIRDLAIGRGGPAGQGPYRRISGGRHHLGFCVPGDLQHVMSAGLAPVKGLRCRS